MSKNIGSFLAFNELWFSNNQRLLLWLLNSPVSKRLFRWILRIRKDDCSLQTKITELRPNSFSFGDRFVEKRGKWYLERTTDFRTHPKFGKRIYYAFKPIWWLIHFWDWAIADRYIPKFSYGFDTLTAYPDPDPETTTVDGYVEQLYGAGSGQSWATLIAAGGNGHSDADTEEWCFRTSAIGEASGNWRSLWRSIFLFNTAAIDDGATISSAIFSVRGTDKSDGLSVTPNLNVYSSAPASNNDIVNGDFDSLGSTAFVDTALTYSSFSTSAYNDFTLNSSGISNISKTGVSKFGLRNANYDTAASSPTWSSAQSYFGIRYADYTGTSSDPKLVVTYVTSTDYPLTAAQGSFTLTGQSSSLILGHIITAAFGSFTLTGFAAGLKRAYTLVSAYGSYTLTGFDAAFKIARTLIAELGTYTLTGFETVFYYGKLLTAEVGNFLLSGQDALFSSVRSLIAEAGTYALTGYDIAVKITRILEAAVGTIALTGQSIAISIGKAIIAAYGSFTLTGQDSSFSVGRILTAVYGAFTVTFQTFRSLWNGIPTIWGNSAKSSNNWANNSQSSTDSPTNQERS